MRFFNFVFTAVFAAMVSGGAAKTDGAVELFNLQSTGVRSAGLEINHTAVQQLRSGAETLSIGSVPLITGGSANFELVPLPIFAPDATIVLMNDNGTTEAAAIPDIKTWYGTDPNDASRSLFVSASADGSIQAMVTGDADTSVTVIAPDAHGMAGSYRLVPANLPDEDFCKALDVPVDTSDIGTASVPTAEGSSRKDLLLELEMMVDVGRNLYIQLGEDDTKTVSYLIDLFGAVNAIYQRDLKIRITLTHVVIWTTGDPFSRIADPAIPLNTFDQLDRYQAYINQFRYNIRRDLAHFLDVNPGLGGVAWLNVLDRTGVLYRNAVSNVDAFGTFPTDNTYLWDTMVVAHEIGHNVGTPHSHCYTPPIDCCFDECAACPSQVPTTGTIMSYCHLHFGAGGAISMRFHDRVRQYLRYLAELSPILSVYADQPNMVVKGVGNTLAMNGAINPASGTTIEAIGGGDKTQTFTIMNNGTVNLTLSGTPAVTVSGSNRISVAAQPSQTTLAPGASTTFDLLYSSQTDDPVRADVQINSNDPDSPVYKFAVEGRVITPSEPVVSTFEGAHPIADEANGKWTIVPIVVQGVPGRITSVEVQFNGEDCLDDGKVGLTHPYIGDLQIDLGSPEGTTVTLMNRPGSGDFGVRAANLCHTRFADNPAKPFFESVVYTQAPFTGTYRPNQELSTFIGQAGNGEWQLGIYDWASPHTGTVRSVSLIIRGEAGAGRGEVVETSAKDWTLFD